MSLHQQPELKKAILGLPQQEKDKLLVRLISKDGMLMKQLHFQLLENESDLEERIEAVHQLLVRLVGQIEGHIPNENHRGYADELMKALKYGSGIVNEHFAITKDKMSEIQFRLFLVSQSFAHFDRLFEPHLYGRNDRLLKYQTGRIKYILGKYEKLHEDLQFEFREKLNEALAFAYQSGMKPHMKVVGLPKEV
ncbi:hypothetical protein [Parapedobacter indicus]|uniref:Uncharacterized protein n=1 Tax=Parapedobacter indicus TaxID=1477437 RepID=A0A1I3M4R3_9SPHI|nr:hypothetical protein [Parapedobacter indicus]PPL01281.1 hypothetical protein CLV26_10690 [Parapedobacter indicus]SFI91952.1 hypothetical protein SAMN05444682_106245 [Parapedobacter indicus]